MNANNALPDIGAELATRVRTVLEFHRWGGVPEGVTDKGSVYDTTHTRLRRDSLELEALLVEIGNHLRGRLPSEAATMLSAGRMYRRAADFAKAREYFLRALESLQAPADGESGP